MTHQVLGTVVKEFILKVDLIQYCSIRESYIFKRCAVLSHVFSFLLAEFILFKPKSSCGIPNAHFMVPPYFLKCVCVFMK